MTFLMEQFSKNPSRHSIGRRLAPWNFIDVTRYVTYITYNRTGADPADNFDTFFAVSALRAAR
jgi:hypothetical protein